MYPIRKINDRSEGVRKSPNSRFSIVRVILINCAALITIVLGFEMYLRAYTPVSLKGYDAIKKWEKRARIKSLAFMVRSSDSILVYENRPHHTRYNGIFTGDFGIIGKVHVALKKGARTIRILIIGDSIGSTIDRTDGHGQAGVESLYCTILESRLNRDSSVTGIHYEVLNMTVNGYTSLQEARLLQVQGMQLDPDIIIWQYCLNDPIPDPQTNRYFLADCPRLYTTEFVVTLFRNSIMSRLAHKQFFQGFPCYISPDSGNPDLLNYWAWVYNPENELWQTNVVRGYRIVSECVKDRDIPVVQVIFPFGTSNSGFMQLLYQQIGGLASASGFYSLNLLPAYSGYPPEKMFFPFDRFHPTEFGHAVAAGIIEEYLRNTILPKLR